MTGLGVDEDEGSCCEGDGELITSPAVELASGLRLADDAGAGTRFRGY